MRKNKLHYRRHAPPPVDIMHDKTLCGRQGARRMTNNPDEFYAAYTVDSYKDVCWTCWRSYCVNNVYKKAKAALEQAVEESETYKPLVTVAIDDHVGSEECPNCGNYKEKADFTCESAECQVMWKLQEAENEIYRLGTLVADLEREAKLDKTFQELDDHQEKIAEEHEKQKQEEHGIHEPADDAASINLSMVLDHASFNVGRSLTALIRVALNPEFRDDLRLAHALIWREIKHGRSSDEDPS